VVERSADRPPIRTVIADDAGLVRDALGELLAQAESVIVVGQCADAPCVVALLDREHADLLITDVHMPPSGRDEGLRLATRLRATHPELAVIVLSAYGDVAYALALLEDGGDRRGYLLKERIADRGQIIAAVDAVTSGGSVIDPKIVEDLVGARAASLGTGPEHLTGLELQTLALVAEGCTDAAIAEALVLTVPAATTRVGAIFAKLELGNPDCASRRVGSALRYLANREASGVGSERECG
jgi:DNA-binding NarL/FixJ family response regulator